MKIKSIASARERAREKERFANTHFARHVGAVAHSVERRRLDGPLERVKLIFPVVESQVSLQRSARVFLRTFNHHLVARFPKEIKFNYFPRSARLKCHHHCFLLRYSPQVLNSQRFQQIRDV